MAPSGTTMANEPQIAAVENMLAGLLGDMPGYFLVQVRIKPTNNIKVFIDGDAGVSIDTCIKINRKLYALLEEAVIFPNNDFSLEVSSPGIGEPLILHRQYQKNVGRLLEVRLNDGTILLGDLKAVQENAIELETTTGKGKKQEIKQHTISFTDIKTSSVQIKF